MKKIIVIALSCILVVLIVFVTISFMNVQKQSQIDSTINSITQYLNNEQYAEAFKLLNSAEEDDKKQLSIPFNDYINMLCKESLGNLSTEKLISFKDAGGNYAIINDTIIKIDTRIANLSASAENYKNGLVSYNNRAFEEARTLFESVIDDDADYEAAQNYLAELDNRDKCWAENITGRNYYYNASCFDGEYLYVPFVLDGVDGIYKVSESGEAIDFYPLSDEPGTMVVSSLNVVGDYIYFIAGENVGSGYTLASPYCIYEMKTDGTGLAIVKEGNFTDLFIENDKIYALSRETGLAIYNKDFEEQISICTDNVISFYVNADGVYYTVQDNLTYDSDNYIYLYDGTDAELLDNKEYMQYYPFDNAYIKHWQNNSAFELLWYCTDDKAVQIRNADIFKFYGILDGRVLYSANGSLGREILYTYDINSNITNQQVDGKAVIEYDILSVFYEQDKLLVEKDGKLHFSDITCTKMQEVSKVQISSDEIAYNSAVIKHIQPSDLYTDSPDINVIAVIHDKQNWHYKDDKLHLTIEKRYMDPYDCNVYVTHIFTTDYSLFTTGNADVDSLDSSKAYKASSISNSYKAIYAQSTDTFTHAANNDRGIIIRHGKVLRDFFDDDMIAYFDDGSMEVYRAGDNVNPQILLDKGATTSFSFGPILVEDYKVNFSCVSARLSDRNPRSAIGYVEPGHYVMVASDGRDDQVSRGLNMLQLARIFKDEGCKTAYNLDGGMTTCVLFMGNYITHRPSYGSGNQWFFYRSIAEIFYVGTSDWSPTDLEQFRCDYSYYSDNFK